MPIASKWTYPYFSLQFTCMVATFSDIFVNDGNHTHTHTMLDMGCVWLTGTLFGRGIFYCSSIICRCMLHNLRSRFRFSFKQKFSSFESFSSSYIKRFDEMRCRFISHSMQSRMLLIYSFKILTLSLFFFCFVFVWALPIFGMSYWSNASHHYYCNHIQIEAEYRQEFSCFPSFSLCLSHIRTHSHSRRSLYKIICTNDKWIKPLIFHISSIHHNSVSVG